MSIRRRAAALGLLLWLGSLGQAQDAERNGLATATALQCVFRLVVNGNWKDGVPHAEVKQADLRVAFTSINADEGTAMAIGQFGRSDIVAKLSPKALHFLQSFRDGGLYVTTVFSDGRRLEQLKAVQTRHEYTDTSVPGFTSSPEQYYGECAVGR